MLRSGRRSSRSSPRKRGPRTDVDARPKAGHDGGTAHTVLQPPGWPRPKGFANGIRARGEMVFVGGMIGADSQGRFAEGFVAQTQQALKNIAEVLAQAGGAPEHIVRLTWYVRDMNEYLADLAALGTAYRAVMGRHYPAMAVVEVSRLVEPKARVEIEATAVLP
jgi:enamine deaminase RidA (YjgF/YER057c/UK114 family)